MITSKPGIGIVAPSGYTLDDAAVARGVRLLEARGHAVHNYFDTGKVFQRFGGTDEARLAQLQAAACNPDIDVIIALRGQYGLSRLLPRIDFDLMAGSGKIFVGFSDFTAFQMGLLAKTGAMSYAGPMLFGDFGPSEPDAFTLDNFWQCLAGPVHRIDGEGCGNPRVEASGTLWGGNLAMVLAMLGTPYFPNIDGGILFFEDVNEHPYRIERMLLQLLHAGVIGRQKAVVLGDFSSYGITPADNGYDFNAMVDYLRSVLPVPVLTGLPFGHGRTRVTIPVGAQARLTSDGSRFTIVASGYPTFPHG